MINKSDQEVELSVQVHSIGNVDTEVITGGSGAPILVLHGFHNLTAQSPFLRKLAAHGTVHAPSLPGFSHSVRPDDFDSIYDLLHFCLDFIDSPVDEPLVDFARRRGHAKSLACVSRSKTPGRHAECGP